MTYNISKMYTYLRGYMVGAGLSQGIAALSFSREKHKDQFRAGGTPYIVHPLQMACYAAALGIRDDDIMAGILLHDIVEECGIPLEVLPVGTEAKRIVKFMTINALPGETKQETKRRYFHEMLECKGAVVVKGLDRYCNMSSMAGVFKEDRILKNIHENDEMLLPMLKEAKEMYPDLSDILFILRTNIRSVSDSLRAILDSVSEPIVPGIPENKESLPEKSPETMWKNIKKEYPETWQQMSNEKQKAFVRDLFAAYEAEGFTRKYWSLNKDFEEYHGKTFEVVRRMNEKEVNPENLPMWKIRFEDGNEISAFPYEVIPREMRNNGCPLENLD